MSITQGVKYRWNEGGYYRESRVEKASSGATSIEETVADGTTDQSVSVSIDVSVLEILFIKSDQDILLETNDPDTPDDSINLLADIPLVWHSDDYHANPLSTDVGEIFLTNSSGSSAEFVLEALQDATP